MKGRSSNYNPPNSYLNLNYDFLNEEHIDEKNYSSAIETTYIFENPKKILSKNESPDVPFTFSINPYQGCEHGCIYCYARNSHTYWGFGAGLDFESKIIVKRKAPELLEKAFQNPRWQPQTIALSGNTDCYQPAERKFEITRRILKVCLKYGNPIGIITKNALVLRDLDVLTDLAKENLTTVILTITSLDEELRRKMEPRTSSAKLKLKVMEKLAKKNIPVGVMMGPIIPGLNDHEIESVLHAAYNAGAIDANYTMIRLNGQLDQLFENWLDVHFPDRKDKILNKIKSMHLGMLNDNRWGKRMRGDGKIADMVSKIFKLHKKKFFNDLPAIELRKDRFRRNGTLSLF